MNDIYGGFVYFKTWSCFLDMFSVDIDSVFTLV